VRTALLAAEHRDRFDAGERFDCAMSSVSSLRERCGNADAASMLEFVLDHDDMTTEVIAMDTIPALRISRIRYFFGGRSSAVPNRAEPSKW
jgi:hypothetical protein